MRKLSLLTLALLLLGTIGLAQDQGDMDQWIANAQAFYVDDVDESALFGNEFNEFAAIKPGMLAPDFTLLDVNGVEYSLSQFQDEMFVAFETGSWY